MPASLDGGNSTEINSVLGFASIPKSSENIGTYQRGNLKSANDFIKKRIF